MFQLLAALPVDPNAKLSQEIDEHLKLLRTEMMHYFPDLVITLSIHSALIQLFYP